MKTSYGNKIKQIITQELRVVQRNVLHELKSLDSKISDNPDIIIKDSQIMNNLLEKFKEAIQIKRQLSSMYIQEDKKLIQISNKHLKDVGTNMIEIFKSQFDTVTQQLIDYNVSSIKQKINNFGGLKDINNFFLQEDQGQNSEHKDDAENVRQFIEAKRSFLIDEIMKSENIDNFEKKDIRQGKTITLKKLFNILSKGINQKIKNKYVHFSDKFVIDNGFKKYYLNFLHPSEVANTEHKNHLVGNVKLYFTKLFDEYKVAVSADELKSTQKLIVSSMENLPPDLKQTITQLYSKSKLQIKTKNDNMLQELSQKMIYNSNEVDKYLAAALKANENGQYQVYAMFIEKLDLIYTEKSFISATIAEKIHFIKDYFIKVLERNQQIHHNNSDLVKRLILKFEEQLKCLSDLVQGQLLKIKKIMGNPTKAQEQNIDALQSITDIFKTHQLIIDLGIDHAVVKGRIISSIEEKLIQVIQIYNQRMENQPQESLSSIEILDYQTTKKMKSFIEYLINTGQLIEIIKDELGKNKLFQNGGNAKKEIIGRYMRMKGHSEIIKFYQSQIKSMLQYADEFQFFDLRKRNMSIKQLEDDMLSIEHTIEILKQRNQFFNNFILSKQDSYDFRIGFEIFHKKLRQLIMDAKIEIEKAFKDLNNDPTSKVNLLMNILRIMKEKKFKMIANRELEQNYKELSKLLKNNFDKVRQKCSQKIKIAYQKKVEVQKQIKIQQKSKKTETDIVQKEAQIKITTITNQITRRFDERIASSADADTKTNYEKGKRIELSSCKNELNHQRQEQVKRIQERYTKIINQLNQSLVQPLSELAQTLALYKKVVLDINYDNQMTVAQFEAVLDEIPKDDAKFIKLIQQQLDTIPNDQFSLGKVLITTNKIFQAGKMLQ